LCPRSAEACIWFLCSSKCQARERFPARVCPASQALPFIFVPFPTVLSVLVFPLPATLHQVISFGSISISQAPSELPSLRLCSKLASAKKAFFHSDCLFAAVELKSRQRLLLSVPLCPRVPVCSAYQAPLFDFPIACGLLQELIPVILLSHQIKRLEDSWIKRAHQVFGGISMRI
jgi:hypothetical protein